MVKYYMMRHHRMVYNDDTTTDKLMDDNINTIFHSKDENTTLTVIPKNGSTKITKILIRNRLDCCLERLTLYFERSHIMASFK